MYGNLKDHHLSSLSSDGEGGGGGGVAGGGAEEDGGMASYVLLMGILCVAVYLVFHNKQKVKDGFIYVYI